MKPIVVPLCVFGLFLTLLVGMGWPPVIESPLIVQAGELNIPEFSFTINPAKYVYSFYDRVGVETVISNRTSELMVFDMSDGGTLTVPAYSKKVYTFDNIRLLGQSEQFLISGKVKATGEVTIQNELILKVEPSESIRKGGE